LQISQRRFGLTAGRDGRSRATQFERQQARVRITGGRDRIGRRRQRFAQARAASSADGRVEGPGMVPMTG